MARRHRSAPVRRRELHAAGLRPRPRGRSRQLRASRRSTTAPAVRVRGAVHRRSARRSLRPGDPYIDCNHDGRWDGNLLGGGGTRRATSITSQIPSPRARSWCRTVSETDGRRGGRPGGSVQRLPAADPGQGPRRRLPAEQHIHLGHARRVGPGQHGPGRRLTNHLRGQQLLGLVSGRPERAGDRAGLPGPASGDDPLHGGARTVERPPVLVLVPLRRRSAHPRAAGGRLPRPNDRRRWQASASTPKRLASTAAPGARRAERVGLLRLDQLLPQQLERRLGGSRSRWPGRWGRSRARRCTGRRSPGPLSSTSTPATRPVAARCSERRRDRHDRSAPRPARLHGRDQGVRHRHGDADHPGAQDRRVPQLASNTIWGARANICIKLQNELFVLGASLGVFAQRPAYNANCTVASPVAANGATSGSRCARR